MTDSAVERGERAFPSFSACPYRRHRPTLLPVPIGTGEPRWVAQRGRKHCYVNLLAKTLLPVPIHACPHSCRPACRVQARCVPEGRGRT